MVERFEASPIAQSIDRIDDNVIVDVNAAFTNLYGYTRAEVIGHTAVELGIVIDAAARAQLLEDVRTQGSACGVACEQRTRSGKRLRTQITTSVVDFAGRPHLLVRIVDLSARAKYEPALMRSLG